MFASLYLFTSTAWSQSPPAAPDTVAPCDVSPTVLPQPTRGCPMVGARGVALRVGRIAVETLLGTGFGALAGLVGAYAGLNVDLLSGHEAGAGFHVGTAFGFTLGAAPGVWIAGNAMGGDGSFGWSLLGSALGTGVSSAILAVDDSTPTLVLAALLPVAGGVVGYELSSHGPRTQAPARQSAAWRVAPVFGPGRVGLVGAF